LDNQQLALALRQLADAMLMSSLTSAGVPPSVSQAVPPVVEGTAKKAKRKVSAYNRRYATSYKRLRRKHTLKNGKLRKGITHKKLVKMAHAEAKKGGKR
jgi:hypothetical protein